MIAKMPGDVWQKHANLRALYGYMFTHPGKKLLFMGGELAQWREWNHDRAARLGSARRSRVTPAMQRWVRDLNRLYAGGAVAVGSGLRLETGFPGSICNDTRTASSPSCGAPPTPTTSVVVVVNFTPLPREAYRIGVPLAGPYSELLNSDVGDLWRAATSATRDRIAVLTTPHHTASSSP